jgi:DNA phosphorothioation system restriction enzyme
MDGMSLRDLGIGDSYRSDRNDLAREFYVPCLGEATSYDRAVGYFTSGSLALATRGLDTFVRRSGTMRLVASPHLTEDDAADMAAGYEYRAVVERALIRDLPTESDHDALRLRLGLLGRLIADGRLEIKIAFVISRDRVGIYHEKLGVFRDAEGSFVAFSGSSNETTSAYLSNFESFEVYRGWLAEDERRARRISADFEALWDDSTATLKVMDFPDVPRDRLVSLGEELPADFADWPTFDDAFDEPAPTAPLVGYGQPTMPEGLELHDYQLEAIREWFKHRGRGIWKMATGTGKTLTSLGALVSVWRSVKLQSDQGRLVVVVLCPQVHLADQWAREARRFGVFPIMCLGSRHNWMAQLDSALAGVEARSFDFVMAIVVNATFMGPAFSSVFRKVGAPIMLIADEVHNLGSAKLSAVLPPSADYRLGLSATPERWFDDVGTEALQDYFGAVIYELGLEEALARRALSPYRYFPVIVPLDEDEYSEYRELTAKIGMHSLASSDRDIGDNEMSPELKLLLLKRARLLGMASGKLPALARELRARASSWFQLVYCAEGGSATSPTAEKQVDAVLHLAGRDLGLSTALYTYETSRTLRQEILERFSSGDDLRVLVSMRCLDEGVDIPDARVAYLLASTTNPRQFIQRRGRILRKAPGKERAEIVDFVVVPPEATSSDDATFNVERRLLRRELVRVVEFARLAENGPQALETLLPLRKQYNLLDV